MAALDAKVKSSAGKIGVLGKTALFAGGAAAVSGLTVVLNRGFKEIAEGERVSAQTAAVLKSTGGVAGVTATQVEKLAKKIEMYSAFDDEAVHSAENLLLTFRDIRNSAGKNNDIFNQATTVVADMSQALGVDLNSAAIQVGKALQNPKIGLTALRRVGVTFTDAQVKQIKTMQESGDLMGAQKIILRELNKEFGGSARAYGQTMPGKVKRLSNSFDDLSGIMIKKLVPALLFVVTKMQSAIIWLQTHWAGISAGASEAVGRIRTALAPIITIFQGLITSIQGVITILTGIWHGNWTAVWNGIKMVAVGSLRSIIGLARLQAVVVFNVLKTFGMMAVNGLRSGATGLAHVVTSKIHTAISFITGVAGKAFSAAASFGAHIVAGFASSMKGFGLKLVEWIIAPINAVIHKINSIKVGVWKAKVDPIPHIPYITVPGAGKGSGTMQTARAPLPRPTGGTGPMAPGGRGPLRQTPVTVVVPRDRASDPGAKFVITHK